MSTQHAGLYTPYVPRAAYAHGHGTDGATFPAAVLLLDVSGFTTLTERLGQDANGAEELGRLLNAFFGEMLGRISNHGGDVINFAGDALICLWPQDSGEDLGATALRALQCGLEITRSLGGYQAAPEVQLSVKGYLGTGQVAGGSVGGVKGFRKYTIGGGPLAQIGAASQEAVAAGDLLISPEAWLLVRQHCVGEPRPTGAVRLVSINRPPAMQGARQALGGGVALRAFVPEAILGRLDAGQSEWLAEMRRVSVLFAQVEGVSYTDGTGQLDRVAQDFQTVMGRYEGTVKEVTVDDKGTVLIAGFGLPPRAHEDDAVRAVRAAGDLHEALRSLGLSSRAGIATGRLFCGLIGNADRRDFAMYGDAMNLSARLMGAAAAQTTLCDEQTVLAVRGRLQFEKQAPHVLKGRAKPESVFRTIAGDAAYDGARTDRAIVGRVNERKALSALLQDVQRGYGRVAVIEGEPGIGKSRLVRALIEDATSLGLDCLQGAGTALESSTPYFAWRPIYAQVLGLAALHGPARLERARDLVRESLGTADLAPLLRAVVQVDLPESELTAQLEGPGRSEKTDEVLAALLRTRTGKNPAVLIIEDCHWLDSTSWGLVASIARSLPPVLLALVTRPMPSPPPDAFTETLSKADAHLVLGGLTPQDCTALASQRLGARALAQDVAELLQQRTEGNPLFIEEMAYALRDQGKVVISNGVASHAQERGDLALGVPETVQGLLTSRIDLLPPGQQLALKVASVIGRTFLLRTLQAVYPVKTEAGALNEYLQSAVSVDLLRPESGPERAYTFKHVTVQEVAYGLMPASQRGGLHQRVAEWYEGEPSGNRDAILPLLAHHWGAAADAPNAAADCRAKQVEYLGKAGTQALRISANLEAYSFFSTLMSLAGQAKYPASKDELAHWEARLAHAVLKLGDFPGAEEHIAKAMALRGWPIPSSPLGILAQTLKETGIQVAHRLGRRRLAKAPEVSPERDGARAYIQLMEIYVLDQTKVSALSLSALRALNLAERAGYCWELAECYTGLAIMGGHLTPRLAALYERLARRAAAESKELEGEAQFNAGMGFYNCYAGNWSKARENFETCTALAERLGDWHYWAQWGHELCFVLCNQGELAQAAAFAERMYQSGVQRRNVQDQQWGALELAKALMLQGKNEESLAILEKTRAICVESKDFIPPAHHLGLHAHASFRLGHKEEARLLAEEALQTMRGKVPLVCTPIEGYSGMVEVFLALAEEAAPAQRREALVRCKKAMGVLTMPALMYPAWAPRVLWLKGRYAMVSGKPTKARAMWLKCLKEAEKMQMPYEIARAHYELGRCVAPSDPQAVEHLRCAGELFAKAGARYDAARAEAAMTSMRTGVRA